MQVLTMASAGASPRTSAQTSPLENVGYCTLHYISLPGIVYRIVEHAVWQVAAAESDDACSRVHDCSSRQNWRRPLGR